MKQNEYVPSVRYSRKEGWYVPQVNGVDLQVTLFDEKQAFERARERVEDLREKDRQDRIRATGV